MKTEIFKMFWIGVFAVLIPVMIAYPFLGEKAQKKVFKVGQVVAWIAACIIAIVVILAFIVHLKNPESINLFR